MELFIEDKNIGRGEWVLGRRWDEYKYDRMVNRWDLDRLTDEGHPVQLTRVYRGEVFNTAVFGVPTALLPKDGRAASNPAMWPTW